MLKKLKEALPFWTPNVDGIWNKIAGGEFEHLTFDKHIVALEQDIEILEGLDEDLKLLTDSEIGELCNKLSEYQNATYTIFLDKDLDIALDSVHNSLQMAKNKRNYLEYAAEFLDLTGNLSLDIQTIKYLNTIRYKLQEETITEYEAKFILPKNYIG